MNELENNPLIGVARRCADFALGDSKHASYMRSALLAIDNPANWPLNLNSIKKLNHREKKDIFFVLTCFVAVLEHERLRDLLQNGHEIFQELVEAERHAILRSATDHDTWTTGYWKEDGKEAMRYRFGSEIVESFDDEILCNHLKVVKV